MEFLVKKTSEMSQKEKESLVALFNKVFSKKRSMDEFVNLFEKNDLGYSYFSIIKNEDGDIVASYAVLPFKYNYFGKEIIFGQSVDTMVREDYRGNPFNLKKMANEVYQALIKEKIPFVFGFPNEEIYMIRKKILKWRDIGKLDIYLTPLSYNKLLLIPLVKLFNILVNFNNFILDIVFPKKIKNYQVKKNTFSGDELYRKSNNFFIIRLENNCSVHCLRYFYKGYKIILIVDLSHLTKQNLKESLFRISKEEKYSNIIAYIGNLDFRPYSMFKIPKLLNVNNMNLCGKVLIPNMIDESIFDVANWKINLSNTDFN